MSGTVNDNISQSNPQLDLYLQRDATLLGRAVNTITDWGRELTGKTPVWQEAAQRDAKALPQLDRGDVALAASGLSARDQELARSMIAGLEREWPQISQDTMTRMVDRTILYVQERADERVQENQMNLFTETMLEQARPFDRESGLQKLMDLALVLREAEDRMTDDLTEADDLAPWERVEDQMDIVCGDKSALAIAAEWGIRPTAFGPPLLTERGTTLLASDLLEKLAQEKSRTIAHDADHSHDMGHC